MICIVCGKQTFTCIEHRGVEVAFCYNHMPIMKEEDYTEV